MNYRNEMIGKTKEKIVEELNEEYENIDVLDARINNLEDLEKDINESIKFETESYFEEISGKTYISPMFFYQTSTRQTICPVCWEAVIYVMYSVSGSMCSMMVLRWRARPT